MKHYERDVYDGDGKVCSYEDRLVRLAEDHPAVIGRLLSVVAERVGDSTLRECGVLEDGEYTSPLMG